MLKSLTQFTGSQLAVFATMCSHRAQTDPDRAWRGLWAELAVLAAEERDRRATTVRALDRDAEGLVDAEEVGALTDPSAVPAVWSADQYAALTAADVELVRQANNG